MESMDDFEVLPSLQWLLYACTVRSHTAIERVGYSAHNGQDTIIAHCRDHSPNHEVWDVVPVQCSHSPC